MDIKKITVIGGIGKDGQTEKVKSFELKMGDIISIVGPTGCGKTTLINDIELFANNNTPSQRRILINDEPIPEDFHSTLQNILLRLFHSIQIFYLTYLLASF